MNNKYYASKKFMDKKRVRFMYIFFDNGDYVTLDKNELHDFDFIFYDKLFNYDDKYIPVVKKGFIKLKISRFKSSNNDSVFMNSYEDYNDNRKSYLENRLRNESGITCIRFFDDYNWSMSILGHFFGTIEEGYLILNIIDDYPSLDYNSDELNVTINPLRKDIIRKITFDFENCESFDIFQDEILDIKLKLDNKLELTSSAYSRVIEGGYLRIKLKDNYPYREINLLDDRKSYKLKHLIKRLCEDGVANNNICRLYIEYEYAGFGKNKIESIEIKDLYQIDEEEYEDEDEIDYDYEYESGYCELLNDHSIIIYFCKLI